MTNIVTKDFEAYMKACYPNGCPETQATEIKQAFFSGAFSLFNLIMLVSNQLSEAEAEKVLSALETEIQEVLRARIGATRKQN